MSAVNGSLTTQVDYRELANIHEEIFKIKESIQHVKGTIKSIDVGYDALTKDIIRNCETLLLQTRDQGNRISIVEKLGAAQTATMDAMLKNYDEMLSLVKKQEVEIKAIGQSNAMRQGAWSAVKTIFNNALIIAILLFMVERFSLTLGNPFDHKASHKKQETTQESSS